MRGLTIDGFNTEWPKDERHRKALRAFLDKVNAWAQNPQGTLILSGPYGIGKTRLAVGALKLYLRSHRTGFHLACGEAWSLLKSLWGSTENAGRYRGIDVTEADLLRKCQQAGLLVIDDLDKIRPGEAFLGWILSIMNYRSDANRATIFTINCPVNQLLGHLKSQASREPAVGDIADALMSRVLLNNVSIQFSADQPDFRKGVVSG